MMKKLLKHLFLSLALCSLSLGAIAQEKTLAYYNSHENEILPDAQVSFQEGRYARTVELCNWYYIIVGDGSADSLRGIAERCAQLSSEIQSLRVDVEEKLKSIRLLAVALSSLNPRDTSVNDCLKWGEPLGIPIADTPTITIEEKQLDQVRFVPSEYVDLGLSVKWATCNLGANSPEQSGSSFAWGETTSKEDGHWSNYKWCRRGDHKELTRYCDNPDFGSDGFSDDEMILMFVDDAAQVNLGQNWRMPTEKEVKELVNECNWQKSNLSGVDGYWITSKKNGNSIFLPAQGNHCFYWTSSLSVRRPYLACGLNARNENVQIASYDRCYGFLVRPVTQQK